MWIINDKTKLLLWQNFYVKCSKLIFNFLLLSPLKLIFKRGEYTENTKNEITFRAMHISLYSNLSNTQYDDFDQGLKMF